MTTHCALCLCVGVYARNHRISFRTYHTTVNLSIGQLRFFFFLNLYNCAGNVEDVEDVEDVGERGLMLLF